MLKQGIKHYNLTDFDYLITYDDSTSKDKPEASLLLATKQGGGVFTNNGTNYINALDSNYNLTGYADDASDIAQKILSNILSLRESDNLIYLKNLTTKFNNYKSLLASQTIFKMVITPKGIDFTFLETDQEALIVSVKRRVRQNTKAQDVQYFTNPAKTPIEKPSYVDEVGLMKTMDIIKPLCSPQRHS